MYDPQRRIQRGGGVSPSEDQSTQKPDKLDAEGFVQQLPGGCGGSGDGSCGGGVGDSSRNDLYR